jgi:threonine dehydrogenase-like Zn-dependent dehydrogenase
MARTIQALRLHGDLSADIAAVAVPELGDDEVRVRVGAAGICGSDLHAAQTGAWIEYRPATTGHEVAGTVIESSASEAPVGTRVVVDSRIPCRTCEDCRVSPRLCSHLTWLGESRPGGFAEELTVPAADVYPIREDALPIDTAVLAEPLAVVLTALRHVADDARTALILGYGPIGALAHLVLAGRGLEVTVAEPHPGRLAAALERKAHSAGEPVGRMDVVIDAAGYRGSVAAAFEAVRRGGTVLVIAIGDFSIDISAQHLVEKGVTIATSVGFDDDGIPAALELLARAPELFGSLVSDRIPLAELPSRLTSPSPTVGKVVVTFS